MLPLLTTRRPSARVAALAAGLALLCPATALADAAVPAGSGSGTGGSGGAGLNGTPTTQASPAGAPVSASGDGLTLDSTASGIYERQITFAGTAPAGDGGDVVAVERQVGRSWQTVAQATVAADGTFTTAWRASQSGRVSFRATLLGPADAAQAASVSPAPATAPLAVVIYRDAVATIYGPGLYGHRTACGQRLTPGTLGVASRTLRCGARVSIDYDGRTLTVAVIDRGPFANGATWDLTAATARALGDRQTGTVGAAVL